MSSLEAGCHPPLVCVQNYCNHQSSVLYEERSIAWALQKFSYERFSDLLPSCYESVKLFKYRIEGNLRRVLFQKFSSIFENIFFEIPSYTINELADF